MQLSNRGLSVLPNNTTDEDVAGFKPPTLWSLNSLLYLLCHSQPKVTYNQYELITSMKINQFIDISPYSSKNMLTDETYV